MITPFKLGNKILGSYKTTLPAGIVIKNDKDERLHKIVEETFTELNKNDRDGIFDFSLIHINVQEAHDLFLSYNIEIIIEFIPVPEKIADLKEVTERLTIGL